MAGPPSSSTTPASTSGRSIGDAPDRHPPSKAARACSAAATSSRPRSPTAPGRSARPSARVRQKPSQVWNSRRAVGIVELGGQHRGQPEGEQVAASLGGEPVEHRDERQVGRGPRLVQPLLADRPGPVVQRARAGACAGRRSRCRPAPAREPSATDRDHDEVEGLRRSRRGSSTKSSAVRSRTTSTRCVGHEVVRLRQLRGDHRAVLAPPTPRAADRDGARAGTSTVSSAGRRSTSSSASSSLTWNGFSGFSPRPTPGEKVSRFGVDSASQPAGRGHACALADEPRLLPDVLDHLEADHGVEGRVRERQRHEVALHRADGVVGASDVVERRQVVVEADDRSATRRGEQGGAVPLAAPGIEHPRRWSSVERPGEVGVDRPRAAATSSSRARCGAASARR